MENQYFFWGKSSKEFQRTVFHPFSHSQIPSDSKVPVLWDRSQGDLLFRPGCCPRHQWRHGRSQQLPPCARQGEARAAREAQQQGSQQGQGKATRARHGDWEGSWAQSCGDIRKSYIKLRWDCWGGIFDVFEMPKFGNKFGKDLLVNGWNQVWDLKLRVKFRPGSFESFDVWAILGYDRPRGDIFFSAI